MAGANKRLGFSVSKGETRPAIAQFLYAARQLWS